MDESRMKTEDATTQDNHSPAPPTDEKITTLDNHSPVPPADGVITTLDNHSPAPPALDLDGGK
ncbi:hypothetical protein ACFXAE_29960 [Streptomyces sp. NPDC059454]|jgi:hypothetical protein|uniref:hypothetical protein n=1 Tax=Streptomyces sp. NPDC059454 TaxID=3346836 RepID=UPI0036AB3A15